MFQTTARFFSASDLTKSLVGFWNTRGVATDRATAVAVNVRSNCVAAFVAV
jgi:hypothetical protein